MDYVVEEIVACLAAASILAGLMGWLFHSVFAHNKLRLFQINKEIEIERLQGEVTAAKQTQSEAEESRERAKFQTKDALSKLQAVSKHITPLELAVADRDGQIEGWQNRFAGLVQEKDRDLAALRERISTLSTSPAGELEEHKAKLAELGTALSATEAAKTALSSELAEHRASLAAVHEQLANVSSEKESAVADLESKLAEAARHSAELTARLADGAGEMGAALQSQLNDAEQRHAALAAEHQNLQGTFQTATAEHEAAITAALAAVAEKDDLAASLQSKASDVEQKLQALSVEHQSSLAELNSLVTQRDEQLKSFDQMTRSSTAEKDVVIGRLRTMVLRIEPLEAEIRKRDAAVEEMQKQLAASKASVNGDLEEAQRRIHSMLATNQSLKAALDGKDLEMAALAGKASQPAAPSDLEDRHMATLAALHEKAQALSAMELHLKDAVATNQDIVKAAAVQTDSRIAALEGQMADVSGRHAAAQSELNIWAKRYAALEAQMNSQTSAHQAILESVDSKQDELDRAKDELASLDTRFMAALSGITLPPAPASTVTQSAASRTPTVTSGELDAMKARIAELERLLDGELPREAKLRNAIAANQAEMAELRSQISDRDERLEAWDSRFHASVGELHGEVGNLTAKLHSHAAEMQAHAAVLQSKDDQINKLRNEMAGAPLAMAAAAGAGGGVVVTSHAQEFGFAHAAGDQVAKRADASEQLRALLNGGLSMRGVQFLPKSAELIPQSLPVLQQASEAMHRFPDVAVEIAGHTDSWGQPRDNFHLSQARAAAVKEYLVNSGIAAWRLIDVGYGDTRPVDSNDSPDGRFANRRIELHVR